MKLRCQAEAVSIGDISVTNIGDPVTRIARPQAQASVGYLRHFLNAPGSGAVAEGAT